MFSKAPWGILGALVSIIGMVLSGVGASGGHEALAQEHEVHISGREIVERLTRLEEGHRRLEERIDGMNQRIDDMNQRISDMSRNLGRRVDELRQLLLWGFGILLAGMFTLIGFVLWDRRSALPPAIRRFDELKEREERLESALKAYAVGSPDLAKALKQVGLL